MPKKVATLPPVELHKLAHTPGLFRWGPYAAALLALIMFVFAFAGGMWRIAAGITSTSLETTAALRQKAMAVSAHSVVLQDTVRHELSAIALQNPQTLVLSPLNALLSWNKDTKTVHQYPGTSVPLLSVDLDSLDKHPPTFLISADGKFLLYPLYLTPQLTAKWNAHWLLLAVPLSRLSSPFASCDCKWSLTGPNHQPTGPLSTVLPDQIELQPPKVTLFSALNVPYEKNAYLAVRTALTPEVELTLATSYQTALAGYKPRVTATWILAFGVSFICALGCFGFGRAIVQFSALDRWLRRIATTDELTELPNRRNFEYVLAHEGSAISALALIDVNDFKTINDTYGHAQGDQLLSTVAQRLSHQSRTRSGTPPRLGDTVYRLGGDEFAIIMRGPLTKSQAEQALQRILNETFSTPFKIGILQISSSGAGGVAHIDDTQLPSNFFQYADMALYTAKENKGYDHRHQLKNPCCLFNLNLYTEKQNRTAMLGRITHALTHQEHTNTITSNTYSTLNGLHLVFQPKIAYADATNPTSQPYKIGYEALMRWFDGTGTKTLVSPAIFIPLIEDNGLMPRFGDWVLRETLAQLLAWHQTGHGWQKVAINVSAAQLAQPDFHQSVTHLLRQTGVPPACLHIEVTESLLTDATCSLNIQHLRGIGCPIALDDFGTGYSSFEALRRFPLDYLKLDRSFIKEVHTERGAQLCKSIIDTGRAFNMTVIAEGVETIAQEELVRSLGAQQIQGFLFSKGLDPTSAIDYLPSSTSPQANLFPHDKTPTSPTPPSVSPDLPLSPLLTYLQAYKPKQLPVHLHFPVPDTVPHQPTS